jgi:hypothetical protein
LRVRGAVRVVSAQAVEYFGGDALTPQSAVRRFVDGRAK